MANFAGQLQSRSPYGDRGLKYFVASRYGFSLVSLSLRRAWIEIFSRASSRAETCRSPYGERGLKYRHPPGRDQRHESLSLRRAWIEMATSSRAGVIRSSRSPYGERGLKFDGDLTELAGGAGRSPYGERGLKFTAQGAYPVGSSRSPYGERGLKYRNYRNCAGFPCRSPYGERGLKLGVTVYAVVFGVSLFLRRAWIEMSLGSSYLTASLCRSPYGECGLK